VIDYKAIATSLADGLNGIARATRAIPASATPEVERWSREMREASKHLLMAFGIDPDQLKNPAIPCGGGWYVEWSNSDGDNAEWRVVQK
jgi:hypothetical protein